MESIDSSQSTQQVIDTDEQPTPLMVEMLLP